MQQCLNGNDLEVGKMTKEEQKRMWEMPGWDKDKHLSATLPCGEIWINIQLFAKAYRRFDIEGNLLELRIVPLR